MKLLIFLSFLLHSIVAYGGAPQDNTIYLDGHVVPNLAAALKKAVNGSQILIGPGEYNQAGILRASYVTISGVEGRTKLHSATVEGKGLLLIKGDNTVIKDIECFNIQVPHKNGACVRLEGKNLELDKVYFHDSEEGVLTGANPGSIFIHNSKFERLGKHGQAHGIYVGGGELYIFKSEFLSAKSQGHEIKSRALKTIIEKSTIASLDAEDSRLIDVPNGGVLVLKDSVLQQGDATSNGDAIGFGLEGYKFKENRIEITNNIILLERQNSNRLIHIKESAPIGTKSLIENNVIVSKSLSGSYPGNFLFSSRDEVGIEEAPKLPTIN